MPQEFTFFETATCTEEVRKAYEVMQAQYVFLPEDKIKYDVTMEALREIREKLLKTRAWTQYKASMTLKLQMKEAATKQNREPAFPKTGIIPNTKDLKDYIRPKMILHHYYSSLFDTTIRIFNSNYYPIEAEQNVTDHPIIQQKCKTLLFFSIIVPIKLFTAPVHFRGERERYLQPITRYAIQ